MVRLEGEHAGKVESGAGVQRKKATEGLIELAKNQKGWKRAWVLLDMEVRLFGRMCCNCCFLTRCYPRELIRANVDTGWVIHVDRCSETIAFTCPSALRHTRQTEHTEDEPIWYLITCTHVCPQPRLCAVSAILHTNASYSLPFNLFFPIHCTTQTALACIFAPWLQLC